MSIDESKAELRARAASRLNFFLMATISREGRADFTARVRNLSAGGMMIETAEALTPGTSVSVQVRGIGAIDGKVAWAGPRRCGIAFATPVDPELARKPVNTSGPDIPVYAKPLIVTERKLSDAAKVEPKGRLD